MGTYIVYHISMGDDLSQGYVGVTNDAKHRWKAHSSSRSHVGNGIRKYNLRYEDNFRVIVEGTAEECYSLENKLRPVPMMGWNIAVGGHGGYTQYTQIRADKISKKIRGIKRTDCQKTNLKNALVDRDYSGKLNPRAIIWNVTSPDSTTYQVIGTLQEFCDAHNLTFSVLRKSNGIPVPIINEKKYNNGRRTEDEVIRRRNTIGWICTRGDSKLS